MPVGLFGGVAGAQMAAVGPAVSVHTGLDADVAFSLSSLAVRRGIMATCFRLMYFL